MVKAILRDPTLKAIFKAEAIALASLFAIIALENAFPSTAGLCGLLGPLNAMAIIAIPYGIAMGEV